MLGFFQLERTFHEEISCNKKATIVLLFMALVLILSVFTGYVSVGQDPAETEQTSQITQEQALQKTYKKNQNKML